MTALFPNRPFGRFFKIRRKICVATTATDRADAPAGSSTYHALDSEAQLAGRYGPVGVEAGEANAPICALDIDSVSAILSDPLRPWLQGIGWVATRLSALLLDAPVATTGATGRRSPVHKCGGHGPATDDAGLPRFPPRRRESRRGGNGPPAHPALRRRTRSTGIPRRLAQQPSRSTGPGTGIAGSKLGRGRVRVTHRTAGTPPVL